MAHLLPLVKEELDRILASKDFYASRRFSDFLIYLVEETLAGRGPEIKAYNIAVEVFKRSADFDPQADSVVRVEAGKLRNRLENYYRQNPGQGEIVIAIPKGHYTVSFLPRKRKNGSGQPPHWGEVLEPSGHDHGPANGKPALSPNHPEYLHAPAFSIVVLPFTNLCGDNEISHLISGIVEEIIIGLTRFQDLSVINANFSTEPQGASFDSSLLAQELGARFVLQGNVQAAGDSMRIRVILTDAQTRRSIWAEKYDTPFDTANLFSVLDEITNKVLVGIGGSFGTISKSLFNELEKDPCLEGIGDFSVYEAVLYYHNWIGGLNNVDVPTATAALERAVALDPAYALVKSMLSDMYAANSQWTNTIEEGEELEARSMLLAMKAEKLNPKCQYAHWAKAFNFFLRREGEEFLNSARLALALNPANSNISSSVGLKMVIFGEHEEGMAILKEAYRLNPFLPNWYVLAPFIISYMNEDLEESVKIANKMHMPGYVVGPLIRAATLGRMGQCAQAQAEVEEILRISPNFVKTGRRTITKLLFHDRQINAIIDGLSLAGFNLN